MMTFLEAEQKIEERAARVEVKLKDGLPTSPRFKVWFIASRMGDAADKLWYAIGVGAITVEGYLKRWLELIEQFEQDRFIHQTEATLKKITGP